MISFEKIVSLEGEEWTKIVAETREFSELIWALRIWTRDLQNFSLTLSQLSYLSQMTWNGNEGDSNCTQLKKTLSVRCLAMEEPRYKDIGIRMFRPKACSPDGYSPGTTNDSPHDI